jgi:hypothetical protein
MRGDPKPEPHTSVSWSQVKPGATITVAKSICQGDLIVLIRCHRGAFEIRPISDAERSSWDGPIYESPIDSDAGTLLIAQGPDNPGDGLTCGEKFLFALADVERPSKPWWKFW